VLAGPSGVGKSSLVAQLLQEEPERFGFSVSTTTRPPREGEEQGVAYNFVARHVFEQMIVNDEFLEYAEVGGELYGTTTAAVRAVAESGKVCLLDVDPQGVEAICRQELLHPFCVWVAPPSFDTLRARLRSRGTEPAEEIDRRVARARDEIEFALSTRYFEKTLVNDNLEQALNELRQSIDAAIG